MFHVPLYIMCVCFLVLVSLCLPVSLFPSFLSRVHSKFNCLFVISPSSYPPSLPAFLSLLLSLCLPSVCLLCLLVCLPPSVPVYLPSILFVSFLACITLPCLLACLPAYLCASLTDCLPFSFECLSPLVEIITN